MILQILAIVLGLALLVWSATRFIDGASATAEHFDVPPLLIGLVIVGFGTSAPEMVVSSLAAIGGNPELAIGNAIGSNIVNAGLVLGITALIAPIAVASNIVRKEIPILIAAGLIFGFLIYDGSLTRLESLFLLLGFTALVGWTIYTSYKNQGDHLATEIEQHLSTPKKPLRSALFWLVFGLTMLIVSSRVLVWGAVSIAEYFGLSSLIIGLTVIALGTSLPELASSIVAARRGEHDIAIGNVVGSNMFNILAVTGVSGLISPISNIASEVFLRDWSVMMLLSIALMAVVYSRTASGRVTRIEGLLLLCIYVTYISYLIYYATQASS